MKVTQLYLTLQPHTQYSPWNFLGQNTGVGSLFLLQGIFPTQWSIPGLPHCKWILYQISHKESSRILEWVVYPFSSGSSKPRNQTGVSCIAGGFLLAELPEKPNSPYIYFLIKKKKRCIGDGQKVNLWCWAPCRVYGSRNAVLYIRNLYDVIAQCYLNLKIIFKISLWG